MKKKGLIIATIVMVLVLAVSLTTATYAWFTASAVTTVDQITVNINAANAVSIGARTNTAAITTANGQEDYMYGSVTLGHGGENAATANDPTYTGGETGLGTELAFTSATTLTLSTGVNSATTVTERTGDSAPYTAGSVTGADTTKFNPTKKVYKANASQASDTAIDDTTILYANANADYVVLKMGAQAAQSGVKGIYATVTVKTTGTAPTLKMAAALHFYIRVANRYASGENAGKLDGTYSYVEFDLFGTETRNTTKTTLGTSGHTTGATGVTLGNDGTQGTATFSFLIAGVNNKDAETDLKTDGTYITPFEIYAGVWGPDEDCVSTATGCGVTIDIEFFGVQTQNASSLLTLNVEA